MVSRLLWSCFPNERMSLKSYPHFCVLQIKKQSGQILHVKLLFLILLLFKVLKVLPLESVVQALLPKMVLSAVTGGVGTDECEVYGGPFLVQSYFYCE